MTTQVPYFALAVERANVSPLEAKLRELIPDASGMKEEDFLLITTSRAGPRVELVQDKSLTLLFFTLGTMPDDEKASEFCYSPGFGVSTLVEEARRNSPMPTFLNEDRIEKVDFVQKDDVIRGTIKFSAPGLYRGKANFVANKRAEDWQIIEFSFPKHGIHIVRSDSEKLWGLKKQLTPEKD